MLVLSRKPGEKIQIGDLITITIVRIGPNSVRIGIDAPKGLAVVRSELAALGTIIEETPTSALVDVPA